MAINLDLEMKRQIGFDMLIIVVDFHHDLIKEIWRQKDEICSR